MTATVRNPGCSILTDALTISELIEQLKSLPQDLVVRAEGYDQSCFAIVAVEVITMEDEGLVAVLRTSDELITLLY